MNEAFLKKRRLVSSHDFQTVLSRKSIRIRDPYFTFRIKENTLGYARLGLAIAKKQLKRSVDRNRIKRLIRESFRKRPESSTQGFDVVVFASKDLLNLDKQQITQQLNVLWGKLPK